jgi:hypothetical protein
MFVFIAIAAAGFILLLGGSVFGHDHDHDAHVDHDHDGEGADEPTVSIFSIKVLATFVMGFGAGGAIAAYYNAGPLAATGVGFGTGVILALLMYAAVVQAHELLCEFRTTSLGNGHNRHRSRRIGTKLRENVVPNTVAVFYGRKYKNGRGFMSTSAFQLDIDETDIPNKDNVRLRIKSVASCQVSQVPEDLEGSADIPRQEARGDLIAR